MAKAVVERAFRGLRPSAHFAAGANVFVFSAFQILWVTLFPFLAERLGLGVAAVAAAFGVGSLLFLAGAPFWSAFGERHGRVPALLFGVAGLFLSVAWIALLVRAPLASPTAAFVALAASRVVYGLTASAIVPVSQAWQLDADANPARAMHRHTFAQNLGRLAALAFAVVTGGAPAIAGPAGLAIVALLMATNLFARTTPIETRGAEAAATAEGHSSVDGGFRGIRGSLAIALLFACFVESLGSTLAAHVQAEFVLGGEAAARRTAELLLLCALATVAAQALGRGWIRERTGAALAVGIGALALGSALLVAAPNLVVLRLAMVPLAIGIAWLPPLYLARLNSAEANGSATNGSSRGARAGRVAMAHTIGYGLGGTLAALALHFGDAGRATVLAALTLALAGVALAERRKSDGFVARYAS